MTEQKRNPQVAYYCEFDLDTKTPSVVVVVRPESGGKVEFVYTDEAALEMASIMLYDARNALEILNAHGFHEGIELLGIETIDDEQPFTLDQMFEGEG